MGSKTRGVLRAVVADTQPPIKPQTLSIFSGTKHVCGMRSPTQLPLEQEQEWGGREMGFLVSSAGQFQQSQSTLAPPSSTMKQAPLGLGSEGEPPGPTGRGQGHCCIGDWRKLRGDKGTYQPPLHSLPDLR